MAKLWRDIHLQLHHSRLRCINFACNSFQYACVITCTFSSFANMGYLFPYDCKYRWTPD
uniref:Uncharacterized protein n=1 Tax=Arundo donax TaxID=35708 RepID=A0A0A9FXQ5_ARUDO